MVALGPRQSSMRRRWIGGIAAAAWGGVALLTALWPDQPGTDWDYTGDLAAVFGALGAVLVFALWINIAEAQQRQQDVVLVPHRATYDMKLSDARQATSGVTEVAGRMVLETVDSCDGWEIKQRI